MNDLLAFSGDQGLRGAVLRYRIMAFVVGVGLVLLVFVGMPLQFAAHLKVEAEKWGKVIRQRNIRVE